MKVAHLPWDPTPVPAKEQSASSNAKPAAAVPSNGHAHSHAHSPPSSNTTPNAPVKQDAQPYPQPQPAAANYPPPQYPPNRLGAAQERAAYSLYQQFGQRASTQIAQLQQQNSSRIPPMPNQMPPQQSGPFIKQENSGPDSTTDYKPDINQSVPIKTSQTDGAMDEYESDIAQRRAMIAKNQGEGDRLMRAHFQASQQDLEGGGLLVPLDEQKRSVVALCHPSNRGQSSLARAQGDATNDDEDDEDAINSDLDDPDELDNPANEEAEIQEVMLCTYDKVQRVKNKWKCTLKDGILRVDGSE